MTLVFQNGEGDVLFQTEDACAAPNVGEAVRLNGLWYNVVERCFSFKHLTTLDDNNVFLTIEKI